MIFFAVLAVSAGDADREKFMQIYEKCRNLLFSKAYDVLKDHMLAEDALNEAFIRIYRNLDKIEDISSGRSIAFCVTITRNAALSIYRKQHKEPFEYLDEELPDNYDTVSVAAGNIAAGEIIDMINSLGEEQRNIFMLRYSYGLSHKEIASTLGITENNVTVKLHRIRNRLSLMLERRGYTVE